MELISYIYEINEPVKVYIHIVNKNIKIKYNLLPFQSNMFPKTENHHNNLTTFSQEWRNHGIIMLNQFIVKSKVASILFSSN